MRWIVGVWVALLGTLLSGGVAASPERFAIVVGNNRAEQESANLRYADDDAVATHRLLIEAGVKSLLLTRFDADTQNMAGTLKPFGAPRSDDLQRAMTSLVGAMQAAAARGTPTEFLFFYSGHGDVEAGEGFVMLEDSRFTRSLLFALLERSPAANNHVFVDACRSYFLVFDRGPGGRRSRYAGSLTESIPARLANTGFVLSTTSDRDSHEWERYQSGILSHELRSALRGAADVNLDARVSYAELGAFFTRTNQSIKNPKFRPDFLLRAPGGDFRRPLLAWSPTRAQLVFAPQDWGHFYVETASGERLLDAHPSAGQALRLRVPDERPLFVRAADGQSEYVVDAPDSLEVAALARTRPAVASRGALNLALEDLFALPFAASDVRRYLERPAGVVPVAAPRAERPSTRSGVRTAAAIVGLAAAGAGLVLNGVALATHLDASNESQLQMWEANQRVVSLNRASVGCYAVAAVAGGIWAWATWWPEGSVSAAPVASSDALARGFQVDVRGSF
ncbi:MAG TPA: caspase family protein [Polyangiaceae bacterium]